MISVSSANGNGNASEQIRAQVENRQGSEFLKFNQLTEHHMGVACNVIIIYRDRQAINIRRRRGQVQKRPKFNFTE